MSETKLSPIEAIAVAEVKMKMAYNLMREAQMDLFKVASENRNHWCFPIRIEQSLLEASDKLNEAFQASTEAADAEKKMIRAIHPSHHQ